jgi:hypothetical protein
MSPENYIRQRQLPRNATPLSGSLLAAAELEPAGNAEVSFNADD